MLNSDTAYNISHVTFPNKKGRIPPAHTQTSPKSQCWNEQVWWCLFPCLWEFVGEGLTIYSPSVLFCCCLERGLALTNQFHFFLGQDQSTMAQWAEMTVAEHFLTSCAWATFQRHLIGSHTMPCKCSKQVYMKHNNNLWTCQLLLSQMQIQCEMYQKEQLLKCRSDHEDAWCKMLNQH